MVLSSTARATAWAETANLRCTTITGVVALDGLAADWNALAEASPEVLPTSSYAFIRSFLDHQMDPANNWRCLVAYDGPRLVGLLPVVTVHGTLAGLARPRLRTPENLHLPSVTLLTAAGYEDAVIPLFLKELERQEPRYFSLSFHRLHERSAPLRAGKTAWQTAFMFHRINGYGAYLPIVGTFPGYLGTLDHKLRQNLARREKKLRQLGNFCPEFLVGDDVTDEAFEDFLTLEASGWKGAQGTAILSSPVRREFYRALVRRLREAGWAELHRLRLDGRTIAAQFAVRMGRCLNAWKVAYDEEYSTYGPGVLLFGKGVERAFAQGDTDEINCLTEMPLEKEWRLSRRPYYDLCVYPKGPVTYLLGKVPQRVADRLRQIPAVRRVYWRTRTLLGQDGH